MSFTGTTKISELTVDQLKSVIAETNNELLEKYQRLFEEVKELKEANASMAHDLEIVKGRSQIMESELLSIQKRQKRDNVIIKGLNSNQAPKEAVKTLCENVLRTPEVKIKNAHKTFERNGKMTVVAELECEEMVHQVLRNSSNLRGTTISVDKDLTKDGLEKKSAMFSLKRSLTEMDASKKVLVRNERMRVDNEWFHWNNNKCLMSNQTEGKEMLGRIYNNNAGLGRINLSFADILGNSNRR